MSKLRSLLSDGEIIEECTVLSEEMAHGKKIQLDDLCVRLGISVETALTLAADHASRLHGRSMAAIIKTGRRH
ncbi:hypothetical protein ELH27_14815 [Rhizobium leguminosarum]|uniref:hypothetical protein n=1 Tax=Rhizobium ruizarguesonis TaxID=2081791 RepID=UPI0010EA26FA|nr:hypothetical protein [Rhizobium ruizarguesonis]MBC2804795.1 hypothetical protein [Rhizobium ruizarguesonis]TBC74047.1 hypothetical protein ELH27_14815 [Rhizobium leguminosarum]